MSRPGPKPMDHLFVTCEEQAILLCVHISDKLSRVTSEQLERTAEIEHKPCMTSDTGQ